MTAQEILNITMITVVVVYGIGIGVVVRAFSAMRIRVYTLEQEKTAMQLDLSRLAHAHSKLVTVIGKLTVYYKADKLLHDK